MKRLDTSTKKFDLSLQSLLSDSDEPDQSIIDTVSQIISNVRLSKKFVYSSKASSLRTRTLLII